MTPLHAIEPGSSVYPTFAGGRRAFQVTTGFVKFTGPGPHAFLLLDNPVDQADVKQDGYPTLLEVGGPDVPVLWQRHGVPAATGVITSRTASKAVKGANRGGGTRPSVLNFTPAGGFGADLSKLAPAGAQTASGTMRKVASTEPGAGPYIVPADNVLRPGAAVLWTVELNVPRARSMGLLGATAAALAGLEWRAYLNLEWHELDAAPNDPTA